MIPTVSFWDEVISSFVIDIWIPTSRESRSNENSFPVALFGEWRRFEVFRQVITLSDEWLWV